MLRSTITDEQLKEAEKFINEGEKPQIKKKKEREKENNRKGNKWKRYRDHCINIYCHVYGNLHSQHKRRRHYILPETRNSCTFHHFVSNISFCKVYRHFVRGIFHSLLGASHPRHSLLFLLDLVKSILSNKCSFFDTYFLKPSDESS